MTYITGVKNTINFGIKMAQRTIGPIGASRDNKMHKKQTIKKVSNFRFVISLCHYLIITIPFVK